MAKKIKAKKIIKIEKEEALPAEVVLMEDAFDVIMKNAFFSIDFLRDTAFCENCRGKRS